MIVNLKNNFFIKIFKIKILYQDPHDFGKENPDHAFLCKICDGWYGAFDEMMHCDCKKGWKQSFDVCIKCYLKGDLRNDEKKNKRNIISQIYKTQPVKNLFINKKN